MNNSVNHPTHSLGLTRGLINIVRNGAGFFAHIIDLIVLETRLAGFSLVLIIAASIGIVLLIMSAWLLLMSSLAFGMISSGYSWGIALLVLAALNFMAILPLIYSIIRLSRNLRFRFTRKQANNLIVTGDESYAAD